MRRLYGFLSLFISAFVFSFYIGVGGAGALALPHLEHEIPFDMSFCQVGHEHGKDHEHVEGSDVGKIEFKSPGEEKVKAVVMIDGMSHEALTSFSFFGEMKPPKDFLVAFLLDSTDSKDSTGSDKRDILVYHDTEGYRVEFDGHIYRKCSNKM
ncbi:MAG: hypothetical protein PSN37_00665 [Alphaproteobacteria bacterium]|nr:hypothetical protein [Alphaproteobacteria bacterium]